MKTYQLSEKDCNRLISDQDLDQISSSCCKEFRKLSSHLGMKEIDVNDIERDGKSESEKRDAFFKKWKEMKGCNATYRVLIAALMNINCREDAESVCKVLKTRSKYSSASCQASTGRPIVRYIKSF